ncbi:biotin-dependent carboxyltransferase family protein [Terrimonas sp. NA20]|uniref:Biotin-dependent carboxyltransferase family protein n=1 Tax=Terrimonas ginsenosidimutans TaxID=2908004 RepID=A0ABS9KLA6_9BACT|nr:biotin-dependent carboxyltransferase family protein [Terrimonas ginsenosidimutans]MCG2613101.1 biotin-dependent carboxyltransferase family protein [Terrimonas ginsenosidimutans]
MNLRIIKSGVLDTVQDQGRYGWQHIGINASGAMDRFSAELANALVGNDSAQPVLEMHFPAASLFFEQPSLIAICGANFSAVLNGEPVPCYQPILVNKYSILQFERLNQGARAYLAIEGGMNIGKWLNSYSTHLKAGAGGHAGRPLSTDDEIRLNSSVDWQSYLERNEFRVLPWRASDFWEKEPVDEIYILPGREFSGLTELSQLSLTGKTFTLTPQSDRMGYRLLGDPLEMQNREEMISTAVTFGTIQLLPNGQLTILMADHQTTGGYPRIAHVISAHHSRLAQLSPAEKLRFRITDYSMAEVLYRRQQQHLHQIRYACQLKLEWFIHAGH